MKETIQQINPVRSTKPIEKSGTYLMVESLKIAESKIKLPIDVNVNEKDNNEKILSRRKRNAAATGDRHKSG